MFLGFLLNGFFGPFVEELYFRGYLLPRIPSSKRWAPLINVPVVLAVSLLFALAKRHTYPGSDPICLCGGMETQHPHRHVGALPDEYAWYDSAVGVSVEIDQFVHAKNKGVHHG